MKTLKQALNQLQLQDKTGLKINITWYCNTIFTLKAEASMRTEKPLCGGSYISVFKDKFELHPLLIGQKVMYGIFPLTQEQITLLFNALNIQEIPMWNFGRKKQGQKEKDIDNQLFLDKQRFAEVLRFLFSPCFSPCTSSTYACVIMSGSVVRCQWQRQFRASTDKRGRGGKLFRRQSPHFHFIAGSILAIKPCLS